MVIFRLKHRPGSKQEKSFLSDSRAILGTIPVVKDFQVFRQVNPKNDFDFGFSMLFESKDSYENYNNHPAHVDYINNRWLKEVDGFLEIDLLQI
jgi:hypothetical protein